MLTVKIIEIARHSDAIEVMRHLADLGEISGDVAGLRHVRKNRLPIIYQTGTDRNTNSKIYQVEGDFLSYHDRAEIITYLRAVNFRHEPPISMPLFRTPSLILDNMDYLSRLSPDRCQVIYDLQELWRASDNEFWFRDNSLLAVIAILIVKS